MQVVSSSSGSAVPVGQAPVQAQNTIFVTFVPGARGAPFQDAPEGMILGLWDEGKKQYTGFKAPVPYGTQVRRGDTKFFLKKAPAPPNDKGKEEVLGTEVMLHRGVVYVPDATKMKAEVPNGGQEFIFEPGTKIIIPKNTEMYILGEDSVYDKYNLPEDRTFFLC